MYKLYFFLFCAVLFASCGKKYRIEGDFRFIAGRQDAVYQSAGR